MRSAGARTVGQSEESCVVYGMPRVAHEIGGVEHQVTLDKIGPMILTLAERRR
jgi:two-component system chemotaxis response regulator CheB